VWPAQSRYPEHYLVLSGGDDARVVYAASIAGGGRKGRRDAEQPESREVWTQRFREALEASADRERRRGMTVVGPHRDELRFPIVAEEGEHDLRTYGSSGQQRTAALALRLLEADRLRERLEREPVYLLDDVFAELDEGRSKRLLDLFETGRPGQVILTAPKPGEVALRGGGLERWRIQNGRFLA